MRYLKESDWKIFKQIKEQAIQLFCKNALSEYETIIKNNKDDLPETYRYLYRKVVKKDKKMAMLFDGHSRSIASIQLLAMRAEGLADEDLLKKLSEDFLRQTDPSFFNW